MVTEMLPPVVDVGHNEPCKYYHPVHVQLLLLPTEEEEEEKEEDAALTQWNTETNLNYAAAAASGRTCCRMVISMAKFLLMA